MRLKSNERGFVLVADNLEDLQRLAYLIDKNNVFFGVKYGNEDAVINVKRIKSVSCELEIDCDILRFESK